MKPGLTQKGKEGPIHALEWSPKNTEFCVIYGFMPSKVTLFNLKCEAIFEFSTKPHNSIYYNLHGNNILFQNKLLDNYNHLQFISKIFCIPFDFLFLICALLSAI